METRRRHFSHGRQPPIGRSPLPQPPLPWPKKRPQREDIRPWSQTTCTASAVQVAQAEGAVSDRCQHFAREARRAKNLQDGAVTSTYQGDVKKTIEILQDVTVSRPSWCACCATSSTPARCDRHFQRGGESRILATHDADEQQHMMQDAERITSVSGGKLRFSIRKASLSRWLSQYVEGKDLHRHDYENPDRRAHRGRSLPRTDPAISATRIRRCA